MCESTVAKTSPGSSFRDGNLSDEERRRVRERHRDLVEAWLDFADFAAALFKLHEKYGIANGDAGYAAYRKHLRKKYEAKLASKGLTVDPLNEGCRCIYCKLHSDETEESTQAPAEVAPVTEPTPPSPPTKKVDRSILQHRSISPHGETHNRRRLGQVPAEPPRPHQPSFKIANQKLGLVPAYVQMGASIGRSPPSGASPSRAKEREAAAPVRGSPKKTNGRYSPRMRFSSAVSSATLSGCVR